MARYLVVAHETSTNPKLTEELENIAKDDAEAEFVLLVPATPVKHLLMWRDDPAEEKAIAEQRAAAAQAMFEQEGLAIVASKVGAESPIDAIDAEVRANPGAYAGFVISTLPKEHSRWQRMQLPRVIRDKYGLPVHHVELTPTQLRYWLPVDEA